MKRGNLKVHFSAATDNHGRSVATGVAGRRPYCPRCAKTLRAVLRTRSARSVRRSRINAGGGRWIS